ncbi:MAG: RdgB/HAM1 family non-canonical purine NTP pyrophosphatase [Bacteroidetes bacterium]|nr:RdgB/HAM1 family non-canonical purine NTP pyrophosphatase [Bacteroidota bacterium]
MKDLIFASNNAHKLDEIRAMLPAGFRLLSQSDAGFDLDVDETGKTFEDNAFLKAQALYEFAGITCFADDSGLEVKALKGQPGVKSARYSGEPVNHQRNVELLLKNLEGKKDRSARFVTVICLRHNDKTMYFEGEVKGVIVDYPRGDKGFGYDPIFIPDGHDRTFAEMESQEKNAISHRKRAVEKMLEFIPYL